MTLKNYISLIRPLNLFIIVAIMFVTRYSILGSFLKMNSMELEFSLGQFLILVVSVVFISAFGYVSNDLNDIKTDIHNKKDRVLAKFPVQASKAENFSFILLLVGLFLGLLSWFIAQNWMLVFIHFFAAASLFAYSKYLKKTALIGNISIAILCAVVPLIVLLFDMPSVIQNYYDTKGVFLLNNGAKTYNEIFFQILLRSVLIFSAFIFLFSLIREIIKDVEDVSGDRSAGYRTFPVRFGEGITIKLAIGLGVFTLLILFGLMSIALQSIFSINDVMLFISGLFFLVVLPLLQAMFLASKKKLASSSFWLKMSMLGAIVLSIIFGILN